jgi:hypothetical protein
MKIKDALEKKEKPFLIPDCSRDELPVFFKEMCYNTGVEVGIWEGEYTEKFCKLGMKMYGIDPWKARGRQSQKMQDDRCLRAIERLKPYDCEVIRKRSAQCVTDFADESLDFVYIDGDHSYRFVVEDIREWSKKVRKGGIVAGHDYACTDPQINALPQRYRKHEEVGRAVDEYIEANGIENFWILGRSKPLEEELKNDVMLSWFFIKQ